MAQSRQPRFYADWGVPDTVTGRFDMITLHMALMLRRLVRAGRRAAFSQALFDLFFRDMDRSREMGAGDLGVPKKIKKMGNVFYGLSPASTRRSAAGKSAAVEDSARPQCLWRRARAASPRPLAAYLLDEVGSAGRQPGRGHLAGASRERRHERIATTISRCSMPRAYRPPAAGGPQARRASRRRAAAGDCRAPRRQRRRPARGRA